jgi:hypothetical protein
LLKNFVHAARKTRDGLFIRSGDMTGAGGLFKAPKATIPLNDE